MNHTEATAFAKTAAPELILDPINPAMPNTLVVRKVKNGMPFNISLVELNPADYPAIEATDTTSAVSSQAQADAQEEKLLSDALDSAYRVLGVTREPAAG